MVHWTVHQKGQRGLNYFCHAAVVVGHEVYSFGSNNSDPEVHIFNTVSLRWRNLPQRHLEEENVCSAFPAGRKGHRAVLMEDIVYIWGGDPSCNVLYAFDVDAHRWFKPNTSGTVPEARRYHSACVLGKVMYVYGGIIQHHVRTNDIYKLDTIAMVWSLINTRGTPPPVSSSHSSTIIGTKMFVFGGWDGKWDHYNIIRVFDTETNCWLSTPSAQLLPGGRMAHSAFTYNGELYIFGGRASMQTFWIDAWKFNPETFSWNKVEPKGNPCRMSGRMSCCMGDRIILFGGYQVDDVPDDLYILDFSPSLKTLCKLSVIQYGLEQSELPHDLRWELTAMSTNN